MSTLITHLENILALDWATWAVIATLCAIASYFIKEYLAQPPMIIFVFPVMIFCGLLAYYLFLTTEQFSPRKIDQWLMWAILAAICGTVVGIGFVTGLAALRERLGGRAAPIAKQARAARRG